MRRKTEALLESVLSNVINSQGRAFDGPLCTGGHLFQTPLWAGGHILNIFLFCQVWQNLTGVGVGKNNTSQTLLDRPVSSWSSTPSWVDTSFKWCEFQNKHILSVASWWPFSAHANTTLGPFFKKKGQYPGLRTLKPWAYRKRTIHTPSPSQRLRAEHCTNHKFLDLNWFLTSLVLE